MGFLSKAFGTEGAYKTAIKDLNKAKELEMDYYNNQANMDQLQRSENQAALSAAKELLMENNKRAAGAAAVTGASPQAVAMEKGNAVKALSDTATGIARNASAIKDQAMQNYLSANRHYTEAVGNIRLQQAEAETAALSGLLESGISAATSFGLKK